MPLIKIISTGGTIANTGHGLISIDEVLKDIPQAQAMADFEVIEATRVRSGPMRLAQWLDIARAGKCRGGRSASRRHHRHPRNLYHRGDGLLSSSRRAHRETSGRRRLAAQA